MKNFLMIFIFLCLVVNAQQEPLVTDRPDVSESALAVPVNYFQFETGFQIQNTDEELIQLTELSLLSSLLRYGLFNGIELRFEAEYLYQKISLQNSDLEGINGLSFGTKIELVRDNKNFPDAAVLIHFDLPFGNKNFKPETVEPSVVFALQHELSERFGISYNFGGSLNNNFENFFSLYSIAIGTSLSEKLGTYIELFGESEKGKTLTKNFDAGFTYLIQNNFQADISAGINLEEPKDNWFWGIGISFRLPD